MYGAKVLKLVLVPALFTSLFLIGCKVSPSESNEGPDSRPGLNIVEGGGAGSILRIKIDPLIHFVNNDYSIGAELYVPGEREPRDVTHLTIFTSNDPALLVNGHRMHVALQNLGGTYVIEGKYEGMTATARVQIMRRPDYVLGAPPDRFDNPTALAILGLDTTETKVFGLDVSKLTPRVVAYYGAEGSQLDVTGHITTSYSTSSPDLGVSVNRPSGTQNIAGPLLALSYGPGCFSGAPRTYTLTATYGRATAQARITVMPQYLDPSKIQFCQIRGDARLHCNDPFTLEVDRGTAFGGRASYSAQDSTATIPLGLFKVERLSDNALIPGVVKDLSSGQILNGAANRAMVDTALLEPGDYRLVFTSNYCAPPGAVGSRQLTLTVKAPGTSAPIPTSGPVPLLPRPITGGCGNQGWESLASQPVTPISSWDQLAYGLVPGKHYRLTRDIEMPALVNPFSNSGPLDNPVTRDILLDGNGFSIIAPKIEGRLLTSTYSQPISDWGANFGNAVYKKAIATGLFSRLENVYIRNLTIKNPQVSVPGQNPIIKQWRESRPPGGGPYPHIGVLAGVAARSRICNVKVMDGFIKSSSADAVGGLVGFAATTEIVNSSVERTELLKSDVDPYYAPVLSGGGLVGYMSGGYIYSSFSSAAVTLQNAYSAGGLVGYLSGGKIQQSVAHGAVFSKQYTTEIDGYRDSEAITYGGGLVGAVSIAAGGPECAIENSLATGNVYAFQAGGFISKVDGRCIVTTSLAWGNVRAFRSNSILPDPRALTGGFVLSNYTLQTTVANSYFHSGFAGTTQSQGGGIALDDGNFRNPARLVGLDFNNIWIMASTGYPYIRNLAASAAPAVVAPVPIPQPNPPPPVVVQPNPPPPVVVQPISPPPVVVQPNPPSPVIRSDSERRMPTGFAAEPAGRIPAFSKGAVGRDRSDMGSKEVYAADVNGDGLDDLITRDKSTDLYQGTLAGQIRVILSNGKGATMVDGLYYLAPTGYAAPNWDVLNYNLYVVDVNNDRRADLLVRNRVTGYLGLALSAGGYPNYHFVLVAKGSSAEDNVGRFNPALKLLVSDVSGDGRADLVGIGYAGIGFREVGDAQVSLASVQSRCAPEATGGCYFEGSKPWGALPQTMTTSVAGLGDINADGKADLHPFPNQYLLSNGAGFEPMQRSSLLPEHHTYPDISVDNHNIFADVDGDKRADFIAINYGNTFLPGSVRIGLANSDGDGRFFFGVLSDQSDMVHTSATPVYQFPPDTMATVVAADLYGAGKKAIVAITYSGDIFVVRIQ